MRENKICPVCGTGECKFRDGIMCRSWVCSEGIYKGTTGNKGVDKLNAAYHESERATGYEGGKDGFQQVVDLFNNVFNGGYRS